MWVSTSEFAGKGNNEIVSWRYSFPTFLYNFEFVLGFWHYVWRLFGCYSLPFRLSRKLLPVTLTNALTLLFFLFVLFTLTWIFLSAANEKSFKRKKSVGRKFCQLKALTVLLMHLFFTLSINKTTRSDNRHFFFKILKNENKEFLKGSTFCTFELPEKNISRKRVSQDALSKVHLSKYGSYFKFILLLSGDINFNPGPTTSKRNDTLLELLPFHNCSFSTDRMDYQLDSLPIVSNDAWNIFQKNAHLNINSLLSR